MQIDFHHAVTYVLARLAGFSYNQANIIAYSSQHVDDSSCDQIIKFDNGAIYKALSSAHKVLDYRNFDQLADHLVWVPFHFLPGGQESVNNENHKDDFISRIICRPNSKIARELVAECVRNSGKENGLHRLGITMHVYADTWAHQGFAGVQNQINCVQYLEHDEVSNTLIEKLAEFFQDKFDRKQSRFVGGISPLGHGAVLSYPDRPYLKWRYHDNHGKIVVRDNPTDFLDAAKNMYIAMKRYLAGNPFAKVPDLDNKAADQIDLLLRELTDQDGMVRHQQWMENIAKGRFSFGPEKVQYDENDWINRALGSNGMVADKRVSYGTGFINSDWKKFQDALKDHHYYLLRVLFPKYNLCVA